MKYIYEFIGTFFLIFTVGMTVLNPYGAGMFAPLAIGFVLAVMVYAGSHVSGGHYNPAVSLAVYIRGKLSSQDLFIYWIVQLLAAVAAAYVTIMFKGNPAPASLMLNTGQAFIAEFLFTFALCFVVLNVATAKKTAGNSYFGLAVGLTILVGTYAVAPISTAAFNPAIALGLTILNVNAWENIWIFLVSNLAAASLAAIVFMYSHKSEMKA